MAAKRRTRRKPAKRRSRSLSGTPDFKTNRISAHSVLNDMAKPIAIGALGAAAGYFAGKGKNLIVAGVGGLAAIAMGKADMVMPAIIGCAVVVPPAAVSTTVKGFEGLDGLKDFVSTGTNRSKGYLKSVLSNAGLQSVADKIPVSGLYGLDGDYDQDVYDQGYMAGIGDLAALDGDDEGDYEMNGYLLAAGGSKPRSWTAAIAQGMGM